MRNRGRLGSPGLNIVLLLIFIAGVIFGTLIGLLVAGHKRNKEQRTAGKTVTDGGTDSFWLNHYQAGQQLSSGDSSGDETYDSHERPSDGELKVVLCVRSDLRMGKGKMCAQSGHATLALYRECIRRRYPDLHRWLKRGQRKIAVRVQDENELKAVQKKSNAKRIPTAIIHDAGRTQVSAGSCTVLAVGPGEIDRLLRPYYF